LKGKGGKIGRGWIEKDHDMVFKRFLRPKERRRERKSAKASASRENEKRKTTFRTRRRFRKKGCSPEDYLGEAEGIPQKERRKTLGDGKRSLRSE